MVCQSLVRDSLITRFNFVDPDRRVLTRLECSFSFFFLSETLVGAVLTCADNQCFEQKQKIYNFFI